MFHNQAFRMSLFHERRDLNSDQKDNQMDQQRTGPDGGDLPVGTRVARGKFQVQRIIGGRQRLRGSALFGEIR